MSLVAPLPQVGAAVPARRVLIVDDNPMIHEDFRKILLPNPVDGDLLALEAELFGSRPPERPAVQFQLTSAMQGQEALAELERAVGEGNPFSLAFVDLRMPPGWDGVETISRLWEVDPDLEVVICTAYSDYTWSETIEILGRKENLLILKKPFDVVEVEQLAHALTERWELTRRARENLEQLRRVAREHRHDLDVANHDLAAARAEIARLQRQLRAAIAREAVGRLAALLAEPLALALREPLVPERAQEIALTLRRATGALRDPPQRTDLDEVVASVVALARHQNPSQELLSCPGHVPAVRAPTATLHHGLVVLLDEAARRAHRVSLSTYAEDDRIAVELRCEGGRVDPSGLGASLLAALADVSGGALRVDERSEGSAITLELPPAAG